MFEQFRDSVKQLEQDQTFFDNESTGGDLQDDNHVTLVKYGDKMCKCFTKFLDMGNEFSDKVEQDNYKRYIDSIQSYTTLLLKKKKFGGLCPCLNESRSGSKYETKYLIVRSKVVDCIFSSQAHVLEEKSELISMDSMRYSDYSTKLNMVFQSLNVIKSNITTEGGRDKAKKDLTVAIDKVSQFLKSFETETREFFDDALRIIQSSKDLLSDKKTKGTKSSKRDDSDAYHITNRTLVKVHANLQEIMNSAAMVSSSKARESIDELDILDALLKKERDKFTKGLKKINEIAEEKKVTSEIEIEVKAIKKFNNDLNTTISSKIKDSLKRWNAVKTQSSPRPVVEYVDTTISNIVSEASSDPSKLFTDAHKKIKAIGEKVSANSSGGLENAFDGLGAAMKKALNEGKKVIGVDTGDNEKKSASAPAKNKLVYQSTHPRAKMKATKK